MGREYRILCYGDSNTYGYDADNGGRFPFNQRWTGILAAQGPWSVIEEGQNNRTIFTIPSAVPEMNGSDWFPRVLKDHLPVDLVIIYLGINDLFYFPEKSVRDIARGAVELGKAARSSALEWGQAPPEILIFSPLPVPEDMEGGDGYLLEIGKSQKLPDAFASEAEAEGFGIFHPHLVTRARRCDGAHLSREGMRAIGEAVAKELRSRFSGCEPQPK